MQNALIYVFGDRMTGKSSMIKKWKNETVQQFGYRPTKGISTTHHEMFIHDELYNVKIRETNAKDERDGDRVVLKGDKQHQLLENNNIPVFIYILFDVTKRRSFESIENFWIPFIQAHNLPMTSITIVANKIDIILHREVMEDEGRNYAEEHGFDYMEFSIYLDENGDIVKKVDSDIDLNYSYGCLW